MIVLFNTFIAYINNDYMIESEKSLLCFLGASYGL